MNIQISDKELQQLRRLVNRLSSYQADINEMSAILGKLEQRQNAEAPAAPEKRARLKQDRKEFYRQKLRGK